MQYPLDERTRWLRGTGKAAGNTDHHVVTIAQLENFRLQIAEQVIARPLEFRRQGIFLAGQPDHDAVARQVDAKRLDVAAVRLHRRMRRFAMKIYDLERIRHGAGHGEAQQNSDNEKLGQSDYL